MDYVILCCLAVLVLVAICLLYWLPKYAKKGLGLFCEEKNVRDLKTLGDMSGFISALLSVFFFFCCFVVFCVWDSLQQNLVQKISRVELVVFAFLLLDFIARMYAIRKKALNALHSVYLNNIVEARIEGQQKGLWTYKFDMYHEELRGYLDEKPSGDIITVAVLKYDSKRKMYLLQEMH